MAAPFSGCPRWAPPTCPSLSGRIDCRQKGSLSGTVRMETPVIYFYAPREMSVNVSVRFRQGVITEWFPHPAGPSDRHDQRRVPGRHCMDERPSQARRACASFRSSARRTTTTWRVRQNAAPLQVGSAEERFLFYRGVGRLPPPIHASVTADRQIVVAHTRGAALGDIVLFENRDGATAYTALHTSAARAAFNALEPEGEGPSPQVHLQKTLVAHGLYPREAQAMVESWRGSWFEQGTRLFYIVSGDAVDAILPLQIDPKPVEVRRVFVGRLEIVTPATLGEVKTALGTGDKQKLAQYGRFLNPIGEQLLRSLPQAERGAMARRLESANAAWVGSASTTCRGASPRR